MFFKTKHTFTYYSLKLIRVFIHFFFWLRWVFVAVGGLSLVAVSRGYFLVAVHLGFSLRWLLLLWCTGLAALRHAESSQTRD